MSWHRMIIPVYFLVIKASNLITAQSVYETMFTLIFRANMGSDVKSILLTVSYSSAGVSPVANTAPP